ncbi:class I SAM-dependent methyltransferase [Paenibacillus sediminis]|uniref:2-polyprenyl-3-methyl-5-hydroxy-6-metoxy-1, 4-benzoquinol methylase n=1 Tax=Paenibacillus sediminis TaxID=664909 RepID=A0ABS4H496_9BACL|nr:class I SAM-dependent methyltransferase [Paenibacillus sediminis]MBP1937349.1 2-polyprenyl-3-methyl-5-hydroxy-6-metoxy-1,4-benzoquinol methylase [Paenibacillus sediminis]
MRTKTDVFDEMLIVTTELFFEIEKKLLYSSLHDKASNVLDIGCGNASYLAKLQQHFPFHKFTGIEINEPIFQRAVIRQNERMTLYPYSYEQLPDQERYDFIIARLVIEHIADRSHLIKWLYDHTQDGTQVVIIEVDDELMKYEENLPLFTALYNKSRQNIEQHRLLPIKEALHLEFTHCGFHHTNTKSYRVSANQPEVKQMLFHYMTLVSELVMDKAALPELNNELLLWLHDPKSTLEVPMFAMEFVKDQSTGR